MNKSLSIHPLNMHHFIDFLDIIRTLCVLVSESLDKQVSNAMNALHQKQLETGQVEVIRAYEVNRTKFAYESALRGRDGD